MNETYYGKFKLTLNFISNNLFGDYEITLNELNLSNYAVTKIVFKKASGTYTATVTYDDGLVMTFTGATNIINAFAQDIIGTGKIVFDSTAVPTDDIRGTLISTDDLILYNQETIFTYLMDSPKNQVTKTLNFVSSMEININRVINNKNLIVDIANVDVVSKKRFNYVYIPSMNRYYYVQEINLLKDFTSCSLTEDVLMTFSDLIRTQTAFVDRQENSYDPDLVDTYIPDLNTKTYTVTEYKNKLFFTDILNRYSHTYETSVPVIVVGGGEASYQQGLEIATDDDSSMELNVFPYEPFGQANVTVYITDPTSLNNCLQQGNFNTIRNLFNDVGEYLISLRYYPFKVTKFMRTWFTNKNIVIGDVTQETSSHIVLTGVKMDRMGDPVQIARITFNRSFNDFRDFLPYTDIKVYLPYIGFVDMDVNEIMGKTVNVYYAIDFLDGTVQAFFMLYNTTTQKDIRLIKTTDRRPISVEMPLNSSNSMERARNLLMGSANILTGGLMAEIGDSKSALKSLQKSSGSFLNALTKHFHKGNIHGGSQAFYNPTSVFVIRESVKWVNDPNLATIYGKPLEQTVSLTSLTGFTKVGDIHFNPSGYEIYNDEISEIVELLKSGVIL